MLVKPRLLTATTLAALICCAILAHGQNQTKDRPAEKGKSAPAKTPPAPAPGKAAAVPPKPGAAPSSGDEQSPDEKEIREGAEAFTKLYNAHDAKGLAALFAMKAEMIDENQDLVRGRPAIEARFAEQFENEPECAMQVDVDSVRVLTPNIALEEGVARSTASPNDPEEITYYTCVHVKVDGKWLLASVTDAAPTSENLTPHEHLEELSWLLGDWIDESPEASVHSTCDWDDSGNFLIYHFQVKFVGRTELSGTTRIGWDAVAKQFRSWIFDSEGGFTEGLWVQEGDEWITKMNGSTPDGEMCSSTNVYRYIDKDTFTFRSYDRIIDGQLTDNIDEIVIKRRAPKPLE